MQNDPLTPDSTTSPRQMRREILLVLVLAAMMIVPGFFTRDPWNPDEPRYTEVARETIVMDDYILPHLNGETYAEKPPVFFWITAVFIKLGAGLFAGRTTAGLAYAGILIMVYFFGRRFLPRHGGIIAALITATTGLLLEHSKAGVIDPLLGFFTTGAILSAYIALRPETPRRPLWWLLFYAASALAVLTKGPVGFIVPALAALSYAFWNRKHVRMGGWIHLAGLLIMLCIIAAWVIPACMRGGPDYTKTILLSQQAGRIVNSYSHRRGPFYYIFALPHLLLPWTLFIVLGGVQAVRARKEQHRSAASFFVLWLVSTLVFFSLISGKRAGYLVPLIPAAGLLCAWYFCNAVQSGPLWPKWHKRASTITFAFFGAMGVVLAVGFLFSPHIAGVFKPDDANMKAVLLRSVTPVSGAVVMAFGLLLLGVAIAGMKLRPTAHSAPKEVGLLVASVLVISLCVHFVLCPITNHFKSGRYFSEKALPYIRPTGSTCTAPTFRGSSISSPAYAQCQSSETAKSSKPSSPEKTPWS